MNLQTQSSDTGAASAGLPALARFRFALRALEPLTLPEYPGSAWRGLLGHGLKGAVCLTRAPSCEGCLLRNSCVYSTLFETPPPPGVEATGYTALPHPYVLDIDPLAPVRFEAGEPMSLGVTLIGSAIAQVPFLVHALERAGQQGIAQGPGRGQGRFAVQALDGERGPGRGDWMRLWDGGQGGLRPFSPDPIEPPEVPDGVRLRLHTPLRMKRDGRFVGPRDFRLADLLRHLYTRLERLAELYGGAPERFAAGPAAGWAGGIELDGVRLRWHDWTRWSSRQHALMQLGGLLGELTLAGPALAEVWPALWAGQWTHVGKGTAFGLGDYRLEPIDRPVSAGA